MSLVVDVNVTSQIPGRDLQANTARLAIGSELKSRSSARFIFPLVAAAALVLGCSSKSSPSGPTIRIGTSLPYTGKEAALGRNLEQAIILAVEDVNNAGGIDGVPLELVSRDSNSGSARGLADLQALINDGDISYLIGPEESDLAAQIVPDIKEKNVLNILPGYAAPLSMRASSFGAWMHLAPATTHLGCAFAGRAVEEGAKTVNTLSTLEDYNAGLASEFASSFRAIAGQAAPSVTVQPDQSSYASSIRKVFSYGPDKTMLIAYPGTAANIVAEWDVLGGKGDWYLSPLLRSEAFLANIPAGALNGHLGISPSLSLRSECKLLDGLTYGEISCTQDNARRFIEHFAERWGGTKPFAAAHIYYDAIVLLAFGMQYAAAKNGGTIPAAKQLHQIIRDLNKPANSSARWDDIPTALEQLANGKQLRFIGAAAEYEFNNFGLADHVVFDMWTIHDQSFVDKGSYYAKCFVMY